MFKVPYLNRKRYIVLKAYTWNKFFLDNAPIQVSAKDTNPHRVSNQEPVGSDFRYCYARTVGRGKSATVFAPCSMKFHQNLDESGTTSPSYEMSTMSGWLDVTFRHTDDPYYNTSSLTVGKIKIPWVLYEETGVKFVLARHLQNSSAMMIPSGVLDFNKGHQLHIFNHMINVPFSYEVTFGEPLVSLFPLTERPLHVESYFDREKFDELDVVSATRPYFRNSLRKLQKKMSVQ